MNNLGNYAKAVQKLVSWLERSDMFMVNRRLLISLKNEF
jgi:hypothetical protein